MEGLRRGRPGASKGGQHQDSPGGHQVLRGEVELVRHQGRGRVSSDRTDVEEEKDSFVSYCDLKVSSCRTTNNS